MEIEFSDLLSILSLIISLVSSGVVIYFMIRPNKYYVDVDSNVDIPFRELTIKVLNRGIRPINILAYTISYGSGLNNKQEIFNKQEILLVKLESPIKIKDGEFFERKISRKKIVDSVKEKMIFQKYNQRLWAGIMITTGKTIYKATSIDLSIIKDDYIPGAANYVATDLFIGFTQMEPKIEIYNIPTHSI